MQYVHSHRTRSEKETYQAKEDRKVTFFCLLCLWMEQWNRKNEKKKKQTMHCWNCKPIPMSIRGPNSWNMYNHLEQDMEQWTDSKSGTEYVKVV